MNSYWTILGIQPTDDLSAIKKAYSKQLKLHHPEDDPEGYQRLREAFDAVKKNLKKKTHLSADAEAAAGSAHAEPFPSYSDFEERIPLSVVLPELKASPEPPRHTIAQFMEKAENIYRSITWRIEEEKWLDLLNDELLWSMEHKQQVSQTLLSFIAQHHLLPKNIWLLLENQFQWSEMIKERRHSLNREDMDHFLHYYKKRLSQSPDLSFHYAASVPGIDADSFFRAREAALDAYTAGDEEQAEKEAAAAGRIFSDDPDLQLIHGLLCQRTNRLNEAEVRLKKAHSLRPGHALTVLTLGKVLSHAKRYTEAAELLSGLQDHKEAKLLLARVYIESGQYMEAEVLLSPMLTVRPDDIDIISLLGRSLYKQERLLEARQQFKRIRELEPYDAEAITALADINTLLKTRSFRKKVKNPPSRRELKSELKQYSFLKKGGVFLLSHLRWRMLIPLFLAYFGYQAVADTDEFSHPVWLMVVYLINLFFLPEDVSFSFIIMPALWTIVFLVSMFLILREWKRIYRGLR
ncbi:tetratricopeptide repeat protein [Fictibacillus iocasae]|uniref:Tetratricopeptide repeat protein n=1 Tax=Fictibacillus iocasae TaxID=2715437 RepID=A0ABW2NKX3_9BACL